MTEDGDTIVAISTAAGPGAIGIVRLSGPNALGLASKTFKPQNDRDVASADTFSLSYGHLVDPRSGHRVDEVLLGVMRAPRSYTREDVVEVHCHGGPVAVRTVLRVMVEQGARVAEPGEFTRRAFVNGRIDLAQAESVANIIAARSTGALRAAVRQLEGGLSATLSSFRKDVVAVLAAVEASVDFSDEEVEEVDWAETAARLGEVLGGLDRLLETGNLGRALESGVNVAIVGEPNVGKSSLLNALVERERAIVSECPGTTRDTVEDDLEIGGIPVRLVDTAGIRERGEEIERMGMERSLKALNHADIVIVVVDLTGNEVGGEAGRTQELLGAARGRVCIVVGNKMDLAGKGSAAFGRLEEALDAWLAEWDGAEREAVTLLEISARTGEGIGGVRETVAASVSTGAMDLDSPVLVGERQRALIGEARARMEDALGSVKSGSGEELVAEDLRAAAVALGRVTGEELGPDILDEIFSRFCLGK